MDLKDWVYTVYNQMAGFQTKTFKKHDDYMTPKYAWENIKQYIPKDKLIWEAFYGNGDSGKYLTELGFNTLHEDIDFFKNDRGEVVISNPPFTKIPDVLKRLVELNKPFIMIMPSSKMNTQYFRKTFIDLEKPQIIIPRRRIHFIKTDDDGNILPTKIIKAAATLIVIIIVGK